MIDVRIGDCRDVLKTLPDNSVHCCVTSPPYFNLRSYLPENHPDKIKELGTEQTPEEYVNNLVEVFREIRRVLRDDGTLWLNLGDSYAGSGKGIGSDHGKAVFTDENIKKTDWKNTGSKPKDLIGIPWRVAFALQQPDYTCNGCGETNHASRWGKYPNGRLICPICEKSHGYTVVNGWYLRQDIIWQKNNPMPESVRDRVCKSHEYIFMLSKRPRYYFDYIAIQEDAVGNGNKNLQQMQRSSSGGNVQQTQTASRRTTRNLQEMPLDYSEEVGQEVQQIGDCEGNRQALLLFGEGAVCKEGIQREIRTNGRTERKIPRNEEETGEGRKIQSSKETIRSVPEGKEDEIKTGHEIYQNREREICKTQNRDQTQTSNKINGLYVNPPGVGRHQDEIQPCVCILSETNETSGNGSCDSFIEGREPHSREYSSGLQNMQCKEGGQNNTPKRNKRSVWQVNTKPYKGAHFACFPPKLAETCILAGTSEYGVCSECGSPYERVVEKTGYSKHGGYRKRADAPGAEVSDSSVFRTGLITMQKTVCFKTECSCNAPSIPATVLDPFGGSGTVGEVCNKLGRNAILIELNPAYKKLILERTGQSLSNFMGVSV